MLTLQEQKSVTYIARAVLPFAIFLYSAHSKNPDRLLYQGFTLFNAWR